MKEFKKLVKVKKILLILGIIICFTSLGFYLLLNSYLKNEDVVYLNEVDKEYAASDVEVTLLTDYFATLNESGELERFYWYLIVMIIYLELCLMIMNLII